MKLLLKITTTTVFLISSTIIISAQKINLGIYSITQSPWGPTGICIFKADSTILYFGSSGSHLGGYTTYSGKWLIDNDTLKIWKKIPERSLTFQTGEINYTAKTKPSFDSIYYEIEIRDTAGNLIPYYSLKLADSIYVSLRTGNFKGAIPINASNIENEILIKGGDIGGSFYALKVPLMREKNDHQIKIQLHFLPYKQPFLPIISESSYPLKIYLLKNNKNMYYSLSYPRLKKIENKEDISKIFIPARQYNPSFKPYFDWLESEFLKYCCSQ